MAEYPLMSQLQGPHVAISLFPDAMRAGAAVGNSTKSPLQAIGEGVTQGIENYQRVEANDQIAQIRQQQIEQAPIELQIKQQQLANQQAELELRTIQAKVAADTSAQTIQAKLSQAKEQSDIFDGKKTVNSALANPFEVDPNDPNGQPAIRSIFSDPKVHAALTDDPKYAEQVYGTISTLKTPEGVPAFSPDEIGAFGSRINFLKQLENAHKEEMENAKARAKLATDFENDFNKVTSNGPLASLLNGRPPSVLPKIEAYPEGTKNVDAQGRIIPGSDLTPSLETRSLRRYDIFENGVKTDRQIDETSFGLLAKAKNSYNSTYGGQGTPSQVQAQPTNPDVAEEPSLAANGAAAGLAAGGLEAPKTQQAVVSNNNIVAQKIKQFNELAKNPPQGIVGGSLEARLAQRNKEIQTKLSPTGASPVTTLTTPPAPLPPTPPKANVSLSEAVGRPVELATLVTHTPDPVTWNTVNSNPLTANESALVKGQVAIESGGKTDAVSPTGVRGIMQVTKAVADQYGLDRNDPAQNLLAGKKYLAEQLTRFNGDLRLALTAYSAAGPGNVLDAVKAAGTTDWPAVRAQLKLSLSPERYAQAENYADKVISSASHFVRKGVPTDDTFVNMLAANNLLKG